MNNRKKVVFTGLVSSIALSFLLSACSGSGLGLNENTFGAATDLFKAATLSDNDVRTIAFGAAQEMDKENKLAGIITNRDMRFIASDDYVTLKVKDVMTKENLVTGPSNISKDDAHRLLAQHKVEKLPLVDEEGHLTGLSRSQGGHLSDDQRAIVALDHASEAPDDLVQAKAGSHGVAQIIYRRTRP